ncbi:MAG: hypothetical protein OJJ55_06635 [Rhodococcus sp.]|nr:hypothetical protein [Rhodococcus sp. (in: high G+C Gram-positive bacteria)]
MTRDDIITAALAPADDERLPTTPRLVTGERSASASPVWQRPTTNRKRMTPSRRHRDRLPAAPRDADGRAYADEGIDPSRLRPSTTAAQDRRAFGVADAHPLRGRIGHHPITGAPVARDGIPQHNS